MITAVDTNILIDILEPDPTHGKASLDLLRKAMREGSAVACEVVWAEVATAYSETINELLSGLADVGIAFLPMTEAAAVESAECWRIYRKQSGKSGRIVADFLIGGHAITQCDRLLTRDRGFYRDYFKKLSLLT